MPKQPFKPIVVLGLLLALACGAHAQETILQCTDSGYCIPAIDGMPRSKGLIIRQERVENYSITSSPTNNNGPIGDGRIDNNRRWSFKLRLPILNREKLKIALGTHYSVEEYRFFDASDLSYPLYQSLEDKSLKSFGGALYLMKPFKRDRYLIVRGGARLNGDYSISDRPKAEFIKYSLSALYGIKRNQSMTWAAGLAYSYGFGQVAIYPVLSYFKSFNKRWGVEALLPVYAKLRLAPNEHYRFYLGTELHGANYNLHLTDSTLAPAGETVFLEKSEVRYLLSYEREIHDFLWFGVSAGARTNMGFNLASDFRSIATNRLMNNQLGNALLFNVSVFIVPPRKFLD